MIISISESHTQSNIALYAVVAKKHQYMNKYIDTKDEIFTQINPINATANVIHVLEEDIHIHIQVYKLIFTKI